MSDFCDVYRCSREEAKRLKELTQWRESHKENIVCRKAIEEAIRNNFDGMHLKAECIQSIIERFGYHRTTYVLANSIQYKSSDGRFSRGNRDWANHTYVPQEQELLINSEFAVDSHPAVVDGFVTLYRKAYQERGLFDYTHCLSDTNQQDFDGKVIVLSSRILKESCLTPENQLWLCTGGFGSRANSRGRAVFATCLGDGEHTRWNREDFAGVLAESFLPDWARDKLKQMQDQQQSEKPTPGGFEMK